MDLKGDTMPGTAAFVPTKLSPGTIFAGDFCLQCLLRSDGRSTWIAERLSSKTCCCLKLVPAESPPSAEQMRRFEIEATVGTRLGIPHIAEVVATGLEVSTQTPWLAMELLRGEDLAATIEQRDFLPLEEARQILDQVCSGLAAAHQAQVGHGNLKPNNIFLARLPDTPEVNVKILGFGLTGLQTACAVGHGVRGTPLWMAPERLTPGRTSGPAADVWSLGLLAFYLLTGRHYWHAANVRPRSPMSILREVMLGELAAASEHAAHYGCSSRLPAGFDAWFGRCIAREAGARFANAADAHAGFSRLFPSERPEDAIRSRSGQVFAHSAQEACDQEEPHLALADQMEQDGVLLTEAAAEDKRSEQRPNHSSVSQPPLSAQATLVAGSKSAVPARTRRRSRLWMALSLALAALVLTGIAVAWVVKRKPISPSTLAPVVAAPASPPRPIRKPVPALPDAPVASSVDAHPRAQPGAPQATCDTAQQCLRLGMRELTASRREPARAAKLLQRACQYGSAEGCYQLGTLYKHGIGVRADLRRSMRFYDRACTNGSKTGCLRVVEVLERGCDSGIIQHCTELGLLFLDADKIPHGARHGVELLRRGCSGGDRLACQTLERVFPQQLSPLPPGQQQPPVPRPAPLIPGHPPVKV